MASPVRSAQEPDRRKTQFNVETERSNHGATGRKGNNSNPCSDPLTAGILDHDNYGVSDPNDCEDYCLHRQVSWTNGSANSSDWSHPGKQWQ